MKQALLAAVLVVGISNVASAQITEVHTRCLPSGSHFQLEAGTPVYNYEATISGCTLAYVATLDVYHNGVRKASISQVVLTPAGSYCFAAPVEMSSWGLKPGDSVTFRLKVASLSWGNILAVHTLIGDVVTVEKSTEQTTE